MELFFIFLSRVRENWGGLVELRGGGYGVVVIDWLDKEMSIFRGFRELFVR